MNRERLSRLVALAFCPRATEGEAANAFARIRRVLRADGAPVAEEARLRLRLGPIEHPVEHVRALTRACFAHHLRIAFDEIGADALLFEVAGRADDLSHLLKDLRESVPDRRHIEIEFAVLPDTGNDPILTTLRDQVLDRLS